MTELLPALEKRFACRGFDGNAVQEVQLDSILEAGRIAPSGFGMEPWRFVVARTPETRSAAAAACFSQQPATTAPALIGIVALVDALRPDSGYVRARLEAEANGPVPEALSSAYRSFHAQMNAREWAIAQCNFAAAQMMAQAAFLGLATCPIGGFDEHALRVAMNLREDETPALVLALGHCADGQGERRRRPLAEIVTYR